MPLTMDEALMGVIRFAGAGLSDAPEGAWGEADEEPVTVMSDINLINLAHVIAKIGGEVIVNTDEPEADPFGKVLQTRLRRECDGSLSMKLSLVEPTKESA